MGGDHLVGKHNRPRSGRQTKGQAETKWEISGWVCRARKRGHNPKNSLLEKCMSSLQMLTSMVEQGGQQASPETLPRSVHRLQSKENLPNFLFVLFPPHPNCVAHIASLTSCGFLCCCAFMTVALSSHPTVMLGSAHRELGANKASVTAVASQVVHPHGA